MHRLLNKYFGGLFHKINLGHFESKFIDLDFEAMDDNDALKIVLLYFTDIVLNRKKDNCQTNLSLLNEVDEIDHFQNHLWGRFLWETIYKSLNY